MPGIDEILLALAAAVAGGTAQGAAQPGPPDIPGAIGAGTSAGNLETAFALPLPQTQGVGTGVSAIDLGPTAQITEQLAQALAAQGPPPTVPLSPANPPVGGPGSTQQGPPVSRAPPGVPGSEAPPKKGPSIGEILQASPEAILAVAQLLGIGPQQQPADRAAPVPGGTVGNVVPGFNLPQTTTIGQLLAQIPRFR